MLTEDTARIVSSFFEAGKGPSHDELTRMFVRANLIDADPLKLNPAEPIGKMKRCRGVFSYALDNNIEAGTELFKMIIGAVRGMRGFSEESETYIGKDLYDGLKEALQREGFNLDNQGNISAEVLDNLSGVEMTNALKAYVKRAQRGSEDAALVTGTGKDLLEATARHVMVQLQGNYENTNFPMTLYMAFERLGLGVPTSDQFKVISDEDPIKGLEKALFLLGLSINKLRNAEGTGHGRPFDTRVSHEEAKTAIELMGIISSYLLKRMQS